MPVSTTTTVTGASKKGGSTPFHASETTPTPPFPFTTNTPGPITIDYIPGPDPLEDSEGIIVVNSSLPVGNSEPELTKGYAQEGEAKEEDSGSGIIILRVSDPEEAFEANNLNQQLEDAQAYRAITEGNVECEMCTCSAQGGEPSHRKASGGCLNCLQRQDSVRQARKTNEGSCFPCSGASSIRESTLGDPTYPVMTETANGLRHRGSVPNPVIHLSSPSLRTTTTPSAVPSPGLMHPSETSDDAVWSTRSLEDMEAISGGASGEINYEGVRLVPLSQQAALRSCGSLQLVVALSPGMLSGNVQKYMCRP